MDFRFCVHKSCFSIASVVINCDWIWNNLPVTHKDKYLEICISIYYSECNSLRRLKVAGLQFATKLI